MRPGSARVGAPHIGWAVLVLTIAAGIVYGPGLNRVFAGDQVSYFAELDGGTSLADGLRLVDYEAARRYGKANDALFRPLMFTWLAAANSLFTYHHVWWNRAQLALHVLVAAALYHVLVTVRPSIFALPAALLFLVSKPSMELALWNHLGGYLIGWILLLIAMAAFIRITRQSPVAPKPLMAVYMLALAAGGFAHETIVLIGIVAGLLLLWSERAKGQGPTIGRVCLYMSPLLLFAVAYGFHAMRVERLTYVDTRPAGIFTGRNLVLLGPKIVEAVVRWTMEIAVPAALEVAASSHERLLKAFAFSFRQPVHVMNAALSFTMLVILARSSSRAHGRRERPLLALLLGALAAYVGLICLGRARGEIHLVPYYLYFFNLLAMVLVYAAVDVSRITSRAGTLAAVVLAALVVLEGADTRAAAVALGDTNADAARYLTRVARFVDAHKSDPHFTFRIVNPPDDLDPLVPLREGYPDDRLAIVSERRTTAILFRRYNDDAGSTNVLDGRELARHSSLFEPPGGVRVAR